MEKSFEVRPTSARGQGVFALREISSGERILPFLGDKVSVSEIRDFTHYLEVDRGVFLSPSGEADDFVNHSCCPNARVVAEDGSFYLEAISTITEGDEITFDYSAVMYEDPTEFSCSCGANECRGLVRGIRYMSVDQQEKLIERGLVPGAILEKLRE